MPMLNDLWNYTFEITPTYVAHRNRLITTDSIQTVHIKGKRLLINTFKQNQTLPTMCVFFKSKEEVEEALQTVKSSLYGNMSEAIIPKNQQELAIGWEMFVAVAPLLAFLFYLFFRSFLPLK